jgi:hypothetical protein
MAPTVPMNIGRRSALCARAVNHAAGVLEGGLGRERAGRRRGLTETTEVKVRHAATRGGHGPRHGAGDVERIRICRVVMHALHQRNSEPFRKLNAARGGCVSAAAPRRVRPLDYWTVIEPFMFIAA